VDVEAKRIVVLNWIRNLKYCNVRHGRQVILPGFSSCCGSHAPELSR
jgi:hypothetical protein